MLTKASIGMVAGGRDAVADAGAKEDVLAGIVLARTSSGAGPGTKYWLEERLRHITNPLLPVMVGRLHWIVCVWGRGGDGYGQS